MQLQKIGVFTCLHGNAALPLTCYFIGVTLVFTQVLRGWFIFFPFLSPERERVGNKSGALWSGSMEISLSLNIQLSPVVMKCPSVFEAWRNLSRERKKELHSSVEKLSQIDTAERSRYVKWNMFESKKGNDLAGAKKRHLLWLGRISRGHCRCVSRFCLHFNTPSGCCTHTHTRHTPATSFGRAIISATRLLRSFSF